MTGQLHLGPFVNLRSHCLSHDGRQFIPALFTSKHHANIERFHIRQWLDLGFGGGRCNSQKADLTF
jgi:hypothetical protein